MKKEPNGESDSRQLSTQHYCGTCKSIGKLYSQKARLFLNSDITFLSELLEATSSDLHKSYTSINCFSLPPESSIPAYFEFCASVNILLAKFKLEDHIKDNHSKSLLWKLFMHLNKNDFKKAEYKLSQYEMDASFFNSWIKTQDIKESRSVTKESLAEALDEYGEPTAMMTAEVFSKGAKVVELHDQAQTFFELGYQFGKLIYLIDAFEDFDRDKQRNQFNAIENGTGNSYITPDLREEIFSIVADYRQDIFDALDQLTYLSPERRSFFKKKLEYNLWLKKLIRNQTIPIRSDLRTRSMTLSEKLKFAFNSSRSILNHLNGSLLMRRVYIPLLTLIFLFSSVESISQTVEHYKTADAGAICGVIIVAAILIGLYQACCTKNITRVRVSRKNEKVCCCD